MSVQTAAVAEEVIEFDAQVDEALAFNGGDPRKTIEMLLKDCAFLRDQIAMATQLIGRGLTRGWKPLLERPDDA